MDHAAQAREPRLLPETQTAPVMSEAMQLRILTGCHQGAALSIAPGQALRVGSEEDCDVLLSDCGLGPGASLQLLWEAEHWTVQPVGAEMQASPAPRFALGDLAQLGQVVATVCAQHIPWQTVTQTQAQPQPQPVDQALQETDSPETSVPERAGEDAPAVAAVQQPVARLAVVASRKPSTSVLALACALAVVMLGGVWAVWNHAPASAQAEAVPAVPARAAVSPAAQEKAVKEASLAIALVDPALRMQVTPHRAGGVTVSGWVDTVEQFDRLAEALSSLRPLPRLEVRTAAEVLDALTDVGSAQGLKLQFALMGAGKVQARGLVTTPEQQAQILAQLRARAPQGIDIEGGLRVASQQGPAVQRWLAAQGLTATQADWDGEQLVLAVDVNASQRKQLERLLASDQTPLSGVPFLLQTRTVQATAARQRLSADEAGLPFRIRSVVGGIAPYVVLADGIKLQPGGGRSGWRLTAIAPDHLVFDGPKRLEVSR